MEKTGNQENANFCLFFDNHKTGKFESRFVKADCLHDALLQVPEYGTLNCVSQLNADGSWSKA